MRLGRQAKTMQLCLEAPFGEEVPEDLNMFFPISERSVSPIISFFFFLELYGLEIFDEELVLSAHLCLCIGFCLSILRVLVRCARTYRLKEE